MNIRNATVSLLQQADLRRQQAVGTPNQVDDATQPQAPQVTTDNPAPQDRLDIRATQDQAHLNTPEMQFARAALNGAEPNPRLAEIKQRIAQGYYTQPDVQGQLADRLTDELQGRQKG